MLQTQTLSPDTLELIKVLQREPLLNNFRLVGGTALALQMGHRISVDIDLFTDTDFNIIDVSEMLKKKFNATISKCRDYTINGTINGVKLDVLAHRYPWIDDIVEVDGIEMASMRDLAAMKLNAISHSGERMKDFVDLAYISKYLSLEDMLRCYEERYNQSSIVPARALTYWEDITPGEKIKSTTNQPINWKEVQKVLIKMTDHPSQLFGMKNQEDLGWSFEPQGGLHM
ncbi:MAG: nucleotidyl transferase AbiEii/AbiGii toxin family protein [Bacteroidales bacterium]|nr:nucleotidyl transferase AbiEii/AbiGii toxin family protein [Bacteroidales bacterium]